MNARRLRGAEEPGDEPVWHWRLAAADGGTSRHALQPVTVLRSSSAAPDHRYRDPVRHRPGVGAVAV